jgi:hypothetical protein
LIERVAANVHDVPNACAALPSGTVSQQTAPCFTSETFRRAGQFLAGPVRANHTMRVGSIAFDVRMEVTSGSPFVVFFESPRGYKRTPSFTGAVASRPMPNLRRNNPSGGRGRSKRRHDADDGWQTMIGRCLEMATCEPCCPVGTWRGGLYHTKSELCGCNPSPSNSCAQSLGDVFVNGRT